MTSSPTTSIVSKMTVQTKTPAPSFMTALMKDIDKKQEVVEKRKQKLEAKVGGKADFRPLVADEKKLYSLAMSKMLFKPLIAFGEWRVTREVCKHQGVGVTPGQRPRFDTFFLLNGREDTVLPFRMVSRLFGKDGKSLSFADACFGTQKGKESKFSERNFSEAPPAELNPFFILKRKIYKHFKEKYGVQVVLTMTTAQNMDEKKHKEGQSYLELGYLGSSEERRVFMTPDSPWLAYTREQEPDGFSQLRDDLDEKIDRLCKGPVDFAKFSCWDCSGQLTFKDAVKQMEVETAEMQAQLEVESKRRMEAMTKHPRRPRKEAGAAAPAGHAPYAPKPPPPVNSEENFPSLPAT